MADEFSEKLNNVLSNPDAMSQIMSLARSLSDGGTPSGGGQEDDSTVPDTSPPPDLSGLMGMLGGLIGGGSQSSSGNGDPLSFLSGLDPRLIQTGIQLLSEYNRPDNRNALLLQALRPFLKEDRAAKLDRAAQAAKLARIVRVALKLFKEGGSDV